MSGKVGIKAKDGIATLNGEGDDAQIEINLIDQFGMEIPAFAQSTPIDAVKAGDIIYFGASDRPGWVIEKKADTGKGPTFVLMKVDGTRSSWKPPKVTMLGMESGVMVLRSLLTMLPGGSAGLSGMQNALLPMMMMGGMGGDGEDGGGFNMEAMMPMLLMGQMSAAPVAAADGTVAAAPNPMAQMMPMMMMMQMMKGNGGNMFNSGKTPKLTNSTPFNRG
jgi:hypothetical protein